MKIRVADYIASELLKIHVGHVFLVNGGMMMHLVDILGRPNGLKYVCNHHEQSSAMAADGYARIKGELGVCFATSGPGATNVLTGLVGAWQESSPILFLTGQSKSTQTIETSGISGLRQFGTFEVDIVPIVKSVTKYAYMVIDPLSIRYHLEKAISVALSGRPGPVLLDLPLDVQGALVNPAELKGYDLNEVNPEPSQEEIRLVLDLLSRAKRPLILAGYGIRCAKAVTQFQKLIDKLNIPVVTTQLGKDTLFFDHPLFVGHPGPKGDRAGNFAIQTADVIVSIGSSLHSQTTGWESELFAPNATKIQIDLDEAILAREKVNVTHKIHSGCLEFINQLLKTQVQPMAPRKEWNDVCQSWKKRYPVYLEPHEIEKNQINYYHFAEELSKSLDYGARVIADAGSSFYVMGQAFRLKQGQRFISSGSMGAMGFAVPTATGVAIASENEPTVCVTGDGSLMTNIHELATISHLKLNIKLFILNNNGYVSMRNTQKEYCNGHYVGADIDSGVFIPSIKSIATSYKIPFFSCSNLEDLPEMIQKVMSTNGPVLCEIIALKDQKIIPTVASIKLGNGKMQSCEIQNMSPLLSAEILEQELKIKENKQ